MGFTIYGLGGHLSHVTNIIFISFHFLVTKSSHTNLVKNEKSSFQFSYVNDLGPRSRNDIDLQYSHTFINSISCLHIGHMLQ